MRINRQYHNQPTLPTKVHVVKAVVFPVVIYGCESWTIKKAECRRIELWCWRRLSRVSWTARRFNQSILKEISPGYPLEGLMLKLKLQYSGHLIRRTDSLEKTLMLGKIEGRRRRRWQRMRCWMASPTWWAWVWASSGNWWWIGRPGMLQSMGLHWVGHDWTTELNHNQHGWISKAKCRVEEARLKGGHSLWLHPYEAEDQATLSMLIEVRGLVTFKAGTQEASGIIAIFFSF